VNVGKPTAEKNLPLAKQNIKILELLFVKTKGNLSSEEATLLDSVLKDLNAKVKEVHKTS
jgi:hypothetical protein